MHHAVFANPFMSGLQHLLTQTPNNSESIEEAWAQAGTHTF